MDNFVWDKNRQTRTGVAEAVLCSHKHINDLIDIIQFNLSSHTSILLTRLDLEKWHAFPVDLQTQMDYDPASETAVLLPSSSAELKSGIAIVTAGTADLNVAKEAQRTLTFNQFDAPIYADLGVAGLWRLLDKLEDIQQHKILIAVAGMEGALFSVISGLVSAPVIAVPTSVGYGVSEGGKVALESALASCSPGVMTMNINNGFGAANAAIKIIRQFS